MENLLRAIKNRNPILAEVKSTSDLFLGIDKYIPYASGKIIIRDKIFLMPFNFAILFNNYQQYIPGNIDSIIFQNCRFPEGLLIDSSAGIELGKLRESTLHINRCILKNLLLKAQFLKLLRIMKSNLQYLEISHMAVQSLEVEESYINALVSNGSFPSSRYLKSTIGPQKVIFNVSSGDKFLFEKCKFLLAPEFNKGPTSLTTFVKCEFNDHSSSAITKYRIIKSGMHEHHNDKEADLFSSLELHARGAELNFINEPIDWLLSKFYSSLNDYGRSLVKPLLWLIIFWEIYSLSFFYFELIKINFDHEESMPMWVETIFSKGNIDNELLMSASKIKSFINTMGPIGWLYDEPIMQYSNLYAVFLGFSQKVLSTVIWFLWILQIRRRFKLN